MVCAESNRRRSVRATAAFKLVAGDRPCVFLTDFDSGWLEVWGGLRRVEQTPVGQGYRRVRAGRGGPALCFSDRLSVLPCRVYVGRTPSRKDAGRLCSCWPTSTPVGWRFGVVCAESNRRRSAKAAARVLRRPISASRLVTGDPAPSDIQHRPENQTQFPSRQTAGEPLKTPGQSVRAYTV